MPRDVTTYIALKTDCPTLTDIVPLMHERPAQRGRHHKIEAFVVCAVLPELRHRLKQRDGTARSSAMSR